MTNYLSQAIKGYAENYTGLPKACWEAITLSFIQSLAMGMCFFLSLYFVDALHFDITTAGILISCYGIGTMLGGLTGGKLSDNISPRTVSIMSLIIQAIAFFLLIKLKSSSLLMVNLFLLGFSAYGFSTSNDIFMLNQCRDQSDIRLKALNLARVGQNLGLGISGIIIGIFAIYGFEAIFYFFSIILCLCSFYLLVQNNIALDEVSIAADELEKIVDADKKTNSTVLVLIFFCLFLVGLQIAQLSSTYPIYVKNAFPELGLRAVSILFTLDTILIVLFQAPLVNFLKNYNHLLIAGLGGLLMGVGMLILSFSTNFTLGIISCLFWTTGEMLFIPMSQLVCYENSAMGKKGQTMGTYKAVYASSLIIGPTLGSVVYQYGGGDMLLHISFLIGLLCFLSCLRNRTKLIT